MKRIVSLILLCCTLSLRADYKTDDLKRQVLQTLPTLHGWCSPEKALHFIDLVLEVKPQVCVEIGVFGGSSLLPVASTLKFLKAGVVIAVDPWDKFEAIRYFDPMNEEAHLTWWSNINFDQIYSSFVNMLKRNGLEEYCITIRSTAENAVSKMDQIDILYIDGSPGEEAFTKDVLLYLPKVRSGGYIWVNDCLGINRQQGLDHILQCCDGIKVIENGNCVLFKKR